MLEMDGFSWFSFFFAIYQAPKLKCETQQFCGQEKSQTRIGRLNHALERAAAVGLESCLAEELARWPAGSKPQASELRTFHLLICFILPFFGFEGSRFHYWKGDGAEANGRTPFPSWLLSHKSTFVKIRPDNFCKFDSQTNATLDRPAVTLFSA